MRTVMKIGGGILKDAACLQKVVEQIRVKRAEGTETVVVLSALHGVTDFLIEGMQKCKSREKAIQKNIGEIRKIHSGYVSGLKKDIRESAMEKIDENLKLLERYMYGVHYLQELSPRSKDAIQSSGERMSPVILRAFLEDAGIKSIFLDSESAGIIAKGDFENATADMKRTGRNLREKVLPLLKDKVVIIAGYYGTDREGNIKTFGRGGTDYSAGFIANCLDAHLEIWKDVSGFMSADPRTVKGAKRIDRLSYDEAEELGYLGSKILHPKTIHPIREKKIEAEIKNLFRPKDKGTVIGDAKVKSSEIIKSIAMNKKIAMITVSSSNMVNTHGYAARLFTKIAEEKIPVDLISTGETAISFTVPEKKWKETIKAVKAIKNGIGIESISCEKDVALVGIVGEGMNMTPGVAGKMFTSLGKKGINLELISQGASEMNISIVVKESDADESVNTIHDEFIEVAK